jgi:hypothetical protein
MLSGVNERSKRGPRAAIQVPSMEYADYKKISTTPLEDFATVRPTISSVSELFELLQSFNEAKWAFRGQGTDRVLAASIERVAIKPGIAEDYVMREFRRRAHQYLTDLPRDDDLEWLALMQHHGAPTRLLDWTRSPHIAAFFAAQSSNSSSQFIKTKPEKQGDTPLACCKKSSVAKRMHPDCPHRGIKPFVIWAVDVDSVNAEAVAMLGLPEGNNDLSSPENFAKLYWDQPPNDVYLVAAVQPHRMNERLTIQQGLFLFANHALFFFRRCLAALLHHASKGGKPSAQWLHKLVVAAETRLDVLRALNKLNINSATLYPGLDGFCQSLYVNVQIQEPENWPGVSQTTDRQRWVKGI